MLLVLNQSPISTVFPIVRFPGGAKTVLSGDPLYKNIKAISMGKMPDSYDEIPKRMVPLGYGDLIMKSVMLHSQDLEKFP